jgi:hypothetical protein
VPRRIFGLKREGEICIMRSFITCNVCKCNQNDQVKGDEMVKACGTHEEKEKPK